MLNFLFNVVRDIKKEYKETDVTEDRIGKVMHLPVDHTCNIRVDVEGLKGDTSLFIKFEESADEENFNEIATFPIPDPHHGILFAKFKEYVRYTLIVDGVEPNMTVTFSF